MMNILKAQDYLKGMTDQQLAYVINNPSDAIPGYLALSEQMHRAKERAEASGQSPPKTTIAEEMSGQAPPQGGPPQGTPPQGGNPNSQGLMGLPNDTTAGAVMRSRISGQPQMSGNMVANAPQAMADGGPVAAPRANPFASSTQNVPQFGNPASAGAPAGNLFAGAAPTSYANSATTLPVYAQPPTPPTYADTIMKQMAASGKGGSRGASRNQQSSPKPAAAPVNLNVPAPRELNLPANMTAPPRGTPGLITMSASSNERSKPQYMWQTPAARDAYIKSMTKPTAIPAATPTVAPTVMAGGGPIYLSGGGDFPSGPTSQFSDEDLQRAASSPDPELRITALDEMKRRNSMNVAGRLDAQLGRGGNAVLGALGSAAGLGLRGPGRLAEGALNEVQGIGSYLGGKGPQLSPSYTSERGNGQTPTPPAPMPVPGANAPQTPPVVPQQIAPPSTGVSGPPPQQPPAAGGLASILQSGNDGNPAADYMSQIRALIDKQRGDPEAQASEDRNMALMQAGLGMMGAKSRNFLGAIGEGAMPALQAYGERKAERAKNDRALTAEEMASLGTSAQLSQAEQHNAQANAIAIDRANRENETAKFEREVKFPKEQETERARIAAMADRYGGQADSKEYLKAVDVIKAFALAPPGSKADQELLAWARGVVAQNTGVGGGSRLDPDLEAEMARRGLK